jgi:hypothetical protein
VITQNDQRFMQRFAAEFMAPMAKSMSEEPSTPERYRSAMAGLDPWKNETPVPDPELGAYHPAVELRPGLSAAIAVPKGEGPFPVFVIVHGNGLAAGSSQLYRRLTKDIAAGGSAVGGGALRDRKHHHPPHAVFRPLIKRDFIPGAAPLLLQAQQSLCHRVIQLDSLFLGWPG